MFFCQNNLGLWSLNDDLAIYLNKQKEKILIEDISSQEKCIQTKNKIKTKKIVKKLEFKLNLILPMIKEIPKINIFIDPLI